MINVYMELTCECNMEVTPTFESIKSRHFIFLVDVSGSMKGKVKSKTLIEIVKVKKSNEYVEIN